MATQRLPTVNGDDGVWGVILNSYLRVSLDSEGGINVVDNSGAGVGNLDGEFPAPDNSQTVIIKNENKIVRWNAGTTSWEDLILGNNLVWGSVLNSSDNETLIGFTKNLTNVQSIPITIDQINLGTSALGHTGLAVSATGANIDQRGVKIDLGGTGTGAGLEISGTNAAAYSALFNAGNVGIGTNLPTEALDLGPIGLASGTASQTSSGAVSLTGSYWDGVSEIEHRFTLKNTPSTLANEEGRLAIFWDGGELFSISEAGALTTSSYIDIPEIAAPFDPIANTARLYSRDDGGGNTRLYYRDSVGTEIPLVGGGSGTPGGANTHIQFNDGGVFGGDTNFVWDKANIRLGLGTAAPSTTLDVEGVSAFLPAPSAVPLDVDLANSQWSLWIDEVNDEFELRAKKSDGTILDKTVLSDPVTILNAPTVVTNLQDAYTRIWSAGIFYGGNLVDNGNGTVDIAEGEGMLRISNSDTAELQSVRVPAISGLSLADNTVNYIYANYNGGSPQYESATASTGFNGLDKILVWKVARRGTELFWLDGRAMNVDTTKAQVEMIFETEGFKFVKGGSVIGTAGVRGITLNSGAAYFGLNRIPHNSFDTSTTDTFDYYYRDGVGGWVYTTGQTQIDNLRFDDGVGALVATSNNKFINHWVYLIFEEAGGRLAVLYGQQENNTLAEAQAESPPPSVPPTIEGLGALVGRMIVEKGAAVLSTVETTLDTIFSPSAVTTHNTVSGLQGGSVNEYYHLTLADHTVATQPATATQSGYVSDLAQTFAGSKTFTNNLTVGSNTLFVDSVNNNIGINNSSPDFDLDVTGDIRIENSGRLYFGGTGATDNDVSLYRGGVDNLKTDDTLTIGDYTLPNTDGTIGQILKTDGAGNVTWQDDAGGSGTGGIGNVSEDLTPQLGGDLDVNNWKITSASNNDIEITPNGTGNVGVNTSTTNEKLTISGAVSFAEQTAPGGSLGHGKIYVSDSDNHLHYVDENGVDYDVVKNKATAQFYDSTGGLDLNTVVPAAIPWDAEIRKDAGITHDSAVNNSRIYFDEIGWYKISYNVTSENTDSQSKNIKCQGRLNGVGLIIPSSSYAYSRNVSDKFMSNTATFIVQTTTINEYVEIVASQAGSVGNTPTVANDSWVLIERIS